MSQTIRINKSDNASFMEVYNKLSLEKKEKLLKHVITNFANNVLKPEFEKKEFENVIEDYFNKNHKFQFMWAFKNEQIRKTISKKFPFEMTYEGSKYYYLFDGIELLTGKFGFENDDSGATRFPEDIKYMMEDVIDEMIYNVSNGKYRFRIESVKARDTIDKNSGKRFYYVDVHIYKKKMTKDEEMDGEEKKPDTKKVLSSMNMDD